MRVVTGPTHCWPLSHVSVETFLTSVWASLPWRGRRTESVFKVFTGRPRLRAHATPRNVSTLVFKKEGKLGREGGQPFSILCHKDDSCVAGTFPWSHLIIAVSRIPHQLGPAHAEVAAVERCWGLLHEPAIPPWSHGSPKDTSMSTLSVGSMVGFWRLRSREISEPAPRGMRGPSGMRQCHSHGMWVEAECSPKGRGRLEEGSQDCSFHCGKCAGSSPSCELSCLPSHLSIFASSITFTQTVKNFFNSYLIHLQ